MLPGACPKTVNAKNFWNFVTEITVHCVNIFVMTVYPSKIGLGIAIPLFTALGGAVLLMAYSGKWAGFGLMSLLLVFVVHLFFSTRYTVSEQTLLIEAGFVTKITVDIPSIRKLEETNDPISSPAASLDRIRVTYGDRKTVLISPKDKDGFIHALTALNPAIEVKRRRS